jgi:hypothetical protein
MKFRFALIPVATVAAMLLSTGISSAQGYNILVRQAHNIEKLGRELKNEFQTHYTRSSAYRHLLSDANDVIAKADHIDKLSHDPRTSYRHIKADLAELDKLVHHLHDMIDAIDQGRYRGYVEGGLQHVHAKVRSLNSAIHSMENTLVAYSTPAPSGGCSVDGGSYANDYSRSHRSPVRPSNDWFSYFRPLFGGSTSSAPVYDNHGHNH